MAIKIKGITIIPDSVGLSTSTGNTVVGVGSLISLTTGTDNVALGINALSTNTSGSRNIGIGTHALDSNTTGYNNIAIGYYAGNELTTETNNTIIGNLTVSSGTVNTLLIGSGSTERLRVDDTGLYINGSIISSVVVSETAPVSPIAGDLWWDSSTSSGILKIFYQDVDTTQWIDAVPSIVGPAGPSGPIGPSGPSGPSGGGSTGFEQHFLLMGA